MSSAAVTGGEGEFEGLRKGLIRARVINNFGVCIYYCSNELIEYKRIAGGYTFQYSTFQLDCCY